MLQGEISFYINGRVSVAKPGESAFVPRHQEVLVLVRVCVEPRPAARRFRGHEDKVAPVALRRSGDDPVHAPAGTKPRP